MFKINPDGKDKPSYRKEDANKDKRLRQREEARALKAMGYSNLEIAQRMNIPESSIRRYTKDMT